MKSICDSLRCYAAGTMAFIFVIAPAYSILAGGDGDTSEMDVVTGEKTVEPASAEQPAAAQAAKKTDKATAEPTPVVVPENPARLPPKISSSAPAAIQIATLAETLQQRNTELAETKEEVARLKGLIKKILDTNRRERLAMHYNMGCAFRAGKDFKRAEIEFTRAIELDPNDPGVHYNMAILYDDDLKDRKKAQLHYEKFLELAPDDKDAAKVREWLSSITMKVQEDK
jgi:tetratricopeptide (TPR) repeat protein